MKYAKQSAFKGDIMWLKELMVLLLLIAIGKSNFTIVSRENRLLSRRKRYLMFPMGSNFVITLSYAKALLQVQPRGWNLLGECDVPFALPADTRELKENYLNHYRQRRDVYSQIETALYQKGLNGRACVKRMICEFRHLGRPKGKSMVNDILAAIFSDYAEEVYEDEVNICSEDTFINCPISLMELVTKTTMP